MMGRSRLVVLAAVVAMMVGVLIPSRAMADFTEQVEPDTEWGTSGTEEGEFNTPLDSAVDHAGNVYVADGVNNRVQKFTSTGAFLSTWGWDVVPGGGAGFEVCTSGCQAGVSGGGAGQFDFPRGIAVDGAGNIYVADNQNNRVQKFASSGAFVSTWGWDVVPGGFAGFEVCTSGCKAGVAGGGAGQFAEPGGVAVYGAGNVYVADELNHRVQKFMSSGAFVSTWGWDVVPGGGAGFEVCTSVCKKGVSGGGAGQLTSPAGIAADGAGNVYVTDNNNRVSKFMAPFGDFVSTWGRNVIPGGPTGFEICTSACQAGATGVGAGSFDNPFKVAVDVAGNVYVTDELNHRVQKFTSTGAFVSAWGWGVDPLSANPFFEVCTTFCQAGSSGNGLGQFDHPLGVGVDGAGNVYVTDWLNDRVVKLSQEQVTGGRVGIGTSDPQQSLHVTGSSGDTRLFVQETSPTDANRVLFELANTGAPQFFFTNSSTGDQFQFSMNPRGDFIVSALGTGGPELIVHKDGRVRIGPGPASTFILDTSGNLTIDGTLTESSDIGAKTGLRPIEAGAILTAVQELDLTEWSYADTPGVRHLGPTAQEFHAAFGLGVDDTGIASLDTSGVALASIQALAAENKALQAQMTWLMSLMGGLTLALAVTLLWRRRPAAI